ncbi:MAG: hypothetical protein ACJA13_003360, partial [Paraglaciecola sp.]
YGRFFTLYCAKRLARDERAKLLTYIYSPA